MYSRGNPSFREESNFYLPVQSSSTKRNEAWEKRRQKKGLRAPNATNK